MKNEQEVFESSFTLLRKKVTEARRVVAAIACTSIENTTPHVVTRSGGRDELAEAASFVVFDKTWPAPLLVVVDGDGDAVQAIVWGILEKGSKNMSILWTHEWVLGAADEYLEYYKNNI